MRPIVNKRLQGKLFRVTQCIFIKSDMLAVLFHYNDITVLHTRAQSKCVANLTLGVVDN